MSRDMSLAWPLAGALALCAMLYGAFLLVRDDPADKPYMKIVGGSFIYNYRVSDVYMGFTAVPERPIPVGSVMEVDFPNPQGGPAFRVEKQIGVPDRTISLRSPSLRGVKADVPYTVAIRLLDRGSRNELWTHNFTVRSQLDDTVVPDVPLTVGPGYQRFVGKGAVE